MDAFRHRTDQLNLTDGMLGQGRDVLVAITTNEDVARLHPAVVRPGRCLARIEVGPLTRGESLEWLSDDTAHNGADGLDVERPHAEIGEEGATLAELVALRKGVKSPVPHDTPSPNGGGFYL